MEREEGELSDEEYEDVSDNSCISTIPVGISGKSSSLSAGREPFRELSLTSVSDESVNSDLLPSQHAPKYKLLRTHFKPMPRRNGYHRHRPYCQADETRNKYQCDRAGGGGVGGGGYGSSSSDSEHHHSDKRRMWQQLRDAVRINSTKQSPNCSLRTRLRRMIETDDTKHSNSDDDHELEALRDQALQSKQRPEDEEVENPPHPDPSHASAISDEDLISLRLVALHSAVLKKHQNRRKQRERQQQQSAQQQSAPAASSEKDEVTPPEPTDAQPNSAASPSAESSAGPGCDAPGPTAARDDDEDEDILRAMLLTSICKKMSGNKAAPVKTTAEVVAKSPAPQPPTLNRFIISVNSDSDSDEPERAIQNSDLFERNLSLFLKRARAQTERHEPDLASHLPGPQQLEYKRLKRKLQQLSSGKRPSAKVRKLGEPPAAGPPPDRATRLHMKGKYEELGPLMARVTTALEARERAQTEVKRLINGLRGARAHLTATHRAYTLLIQQLLQAKARIDKCVTSPAHIRTSTPKKPLASQQQQQQQEQHHQPNQVSVPGCVSAAPPKYSSPLEHIQVSSSRPPPSDPLLVLCPYDLLGECRDADCAYQHCGASAPGTTPPPPP